MSKTAKGLIDYCKVQVGKPYWYGTFGQTSSEALYKAKKKQYPAYYTAQDFKKQYNKRVHDCVGLIKGYLWSDTPNSTPKYNANQDVSAFGMYNVSKKRGSISSFKKVPGQLVYKSNTSDFRGIHHVGVYIGNNKVIEAKGHAYGVITSTFNSSWNFWSECPWIEYSTETNTPTPAPAPITKPDTNTKKKFSEFPKIPSRGFYKLGDGYVQLKSYKSDIKKIQNFLNWAINSKLDVDGMYGPKTETAVKNFQNITKITVDGEYGPNTLKKAKEFSK